MATEAMEKPQNKSYDSSSIQVLEGLEAVRHRPAMYIGSTGPTGLHHLVYEAVDNSIDEVLAGEAKSVDVTIHEDNSVTVLDDGRGIPVAPKNDVSDPKLKGKSALEIVMTILHAGGKFEQNAYKYSGGLHGVGISCVNALSDWMKVEVYRDGKTYAQGYKRGKPDQDVKATGKSDERGTRVTFHPDPEIFGAKLGFDVETVLDRLEAKAYLHGGIVITFTDKATGETKELHHPNGIADFLPKLITQRAKPQTHPGQYVLVAERDGELKLELALAWTEGTDPHVRSYANSATTLIKPQPFRAGSISDAYLVA